MHYGQYVLSHSDRVQDVSNRVNVCSLCKRILLLVRHVVRQLSKRVQDLLCHWVLSVSRRLLDEVSDNERDDHGHMPNMLIYRERGGDLLWASQVRCLDILQRHQQHRFLLNRVLPDEDLWHRGRQLLGCRRPRLLQDLCLRLFPVGLDQPAADLHLVWGDKLHHLLHRG